MAIDTTGVLLTGVGSAVAAVPVPLAGVGVGVMTVTTAGVVVDAVDVAMLGTGVGVGVGVADDVVAVVVCARDETAKKQAKNKDVKKALILFMTAPLSDFGLCGQ